MIILAYYTYGLQAFKPDFKEIVPALQGLSLELFTSRDGALQIKTKGAALSPCRGVWL